MIIKDFFPSQETLDEFILTLGVNQETHVNNNTLLVYQWDLITYKRGYWEFLGNKHLIKTIPLSQAGVTVTEHKKHYHHH